MSYYSEAANPSRKTRDFTFCDNTQTDWLGLFLDFQDILNFVATNTIRSRTIFTKGFLQFKEPISREQAQVTLGCRARLKAETVLTTELNKAFKHNEKTFFEIGTLDYDNGFGTVYKPRAVYFKELRERARTQPRHKGKFIKKGAPLPPPRRKTYIHAGADLPDFLKVDGSFQKTETLLKKPALDRSNCKIQE